MKKVLIIIVTVFLSLSAKAEYNGYHITFTIETTNDLKLKGYSYVASAYLEMDSLQNTNYLKRALNQNSTGDWDKRESFTYFKRRIVYNYNNYFYDQQKQHEYYLTEKTALPCKSIKNIRIDDMIDWSYLSNMVILNTSDFNWLKSKPVKRYFFGSYLCEYEFFVHENNKKISQLLKPLIAQNEKLNQIEKSNNTTERELAEAYENADEVINDVIEQLKGYKVVVVVFCTC